LQYDRPLPPGRTALRKIDDPNFYPDFAQGWQDIDSLARAVENSLNYMGKPSSRQFYPHEGITHAQVVQSLRTFLDLIEAGARREEIDGLVHAHFDVYESIGCDDEGTVLFTGYYTPVLEGALQRTDEFRFPLYKVPGDLVKDPNGQTLGRRGPDGRLLPFPPRAELEDSDLLEGQELIWLRDPFEAYIAHVQGSAKVRLPDGEVVTVGYAATSGHAYRSIAQPLIEEGRIPGDQMSLAVLIEYFKDHPEDVDKYVRRNPRYVFFEIGEGAPRGSLNEPAIPWRTIATDKSIFPRASVAFIRTALPQRQGRRVVTRPFHGFVVDQDTGGAIRAPGRCDVYMGIGEQAGRLAGQTYQEGRLYYLFLKPDLLDAAAESDRFEGVERVP
jgi:membrane-bound lytic murein transglycosylase A